MTAEAHRVDSRVPPNANSGFGLFKLEFNSCGRDCRCGSFVCPYFLWVGNWIGGCVAIFNWRDTSSVLALLGGLWLLLTSLASFGLGGYLLAAAPSWSATISHEVEFRDGIHGLLVGDLQSSSERYSHSLQPERLLCATKRRRPRQLPPNPCWLSSSTGCFDPIGRLLSRATTPRYAPKPRGLSLQALVTAAWDLRSLLSCSAGRDADRASPTRGRRAASSRLLHNLTMP